MTRPRPRALFWPLQVGGWGAFAAAMMIGRVGEWPLPVIAVTELPFAALALLTTLGMRAAYVRLRVRTAPPIRMAAVSLVASYAGSLAWTVTFHLYLRTVAPAVLSAVSGEPVGPLYSGPLLDNTVYHAVLLLAWSGLYFGLQYYLALQEERERALRAEAQAHRAQLRALRYQLNPHFLFNTLNGISTLVVEGRAREATAMIARLSAFLRLTLEHDGAPEVPLADELEFARRYLEIEQARFGERLRVEVAAEGDALARPVPAMILQPLVENAVKHAVAPREEGGRIRIEARRTGDGLLLAVCDDGPGLPAAGEPEAGGPEGHGIGLANTRERLRQLYGEGGRLELAAAAGGGLCASVRIPLRPGTPVPGTSRA